MTKHKVIKRNRKDCKFTWFNGLVYKCQLLIKEEQGNCVKVCNQFRAMVDDSGVCSVEGHQQADRL